MIVSHIWPNYNPPNHVFPSSLVADDYCHDTVCIDDGHELNADTLPESVGGDILPISDSNDSIEEPNDEPDDDDDEGTLIVWRIRTS